MKAMSSLAFCLVLLWSASGFAAEFVASAPDAPQIVLAAGDGGVPMGELLELEPAHLIAIGGGVVVGVLFIGPYLGVSELIAVGLGVIVGELVFRSGLMPFTKSRGLFH
ncbi:MAG: hypothetical protein GC191_06130 [Azospirillum sp.]|nr:hypothetical protein [Azospirillum sp.]